MKLKHTFRVDSSLRHEFLFWNMITHWNATWCWLVLLRWDYNGCYKRSDRLQMIKSDTYNLRWGVIIIILLLCFFGARGKKYIHLTSHQPPPNLHNLTSALPVMLLANQWLPDGNQILVGIMGAFHSTQKSGNFGWFIKWNGPFRFGPTGILGTSFEGGPLWPVWSFRSVGPKCRFPFAKIVVPSTALFYPAYKNK